MTPNLKGEPCSIHVPKSVVHESTPITQLSQSPECTEALTPSRSFVSRYITYPIFHANLLEKSILDTFKSNPQPANKNSSSTTTDSRMPSLMTRFKGSSLLLNFFCLTSNVFPYAERSLVTISLQRLPTAMERTPILKFDYPHE